MGRRSLCTTYRRASSTDIVCFFSIIAFLLSFSSSVNAQDGTIVVEISGIKTLKGEVSIGLYNNSNDFPEQEKAYKGVKPKVDYGFSNNVRGMLGPPDFEDASFQFENVRTVTIELK